MAHKGEPAVFFSREDIVKLAAPYKFVVVGKFSHGRPKLDDVRRFFSTLNLKNSVTIGHLDARHVLMRFNQEADFLRVWTRGIWQIGRFPMRVFHWSPDFHVQRESSLAPVWIALPCLTIHFFDKHSLFSIASVVGRPLYVDAATSSVSRPSVARVCVEVDLLHPLPQRVWVGMSGEADGFWQQIVAEHLPQYCNKCWHMGHAREDCKADDLLFRMKCSGKEIQVAVADEVFRQIVAREQVEVQTDSGMGGFQQGERMDGKGYGGCGEGGETDAKEGLESRDGQQIKTVGEVEVQTDSGMGGMQEERMDGKGYGGCGEGGEVDAKEGLKSQDGGQINTVGEVSCGSVGCEGDGMAIGKVDSAASGGTGGLVGKMGGSDGPRKFALADEAAMQLCEEHRSASPIERQQEAD
nr:uncharacterized protein LOC113705806 [Coffea arabica]